MSAALAAGLSFAGTAVGAAGTLKAGKAQKRIAEYNAQIAERNAKVADQEARQRIWQAGREEVRIEQMGEAFIRNQALRYGASGVASNTGTALEVQMATANQVDDEIAARNYNARVDELAFKEQAVNLRLGANVTRAEGAARYQAAKTQAFASLLSGAGSAYKTYRTA